MKTVFISAGHSDKDPGAVANGYKESDIVLDFRKLVAFYLERAGVPFGMDGGPQVNLPLAKAAQMARDYGIALEFHCNAAANPTATGVEVLAGPKDMELAAALSASIAAALGIRNRGAKPESAGQHQRLAFVQSGGMIVELFFITNPQDLKAYLDKKWVVASEVAKLLIEESRKD